MWFRIFTAIAAADAIGRAARKPPRQWQPPVRTYQERLVDEDRQPGRREAQEAWLRTPERP